MIFTPHDYQLNFLNHARECFHNSQPGTYNLSVAPTGTGKSVMELLRLEDNPNSILITPRLEIGAGMLVKIGYDLETLKGYSDDKLADLLLSHRISTPIRARNMLAKGEFPYRPNELIIDEAHHAVAETYTQLDAFLPEAIRTCLTATPYRGTPRSTQDFLEKFGWKYAQIISMAACVERGYISIPTTKILPLVDDDEITIEGGEFKTREVDVMYEDRMQAIAIHCRNYFNQSQGLYDRPTIVAVSSTASALKLASDFVKAGLPAATILQDTPRPERNRLFDALVNRQVILVQISVISEGVDLPIRRIIDARPLSSPMAWMQQIGRETRPVGPGEAPPEYICTNRNLERHAYLFEGFIPPASIRESQEMFKGPSRRSGARAVGLEGLARYKPIDVPFADKTIGLMYGLYKFDGFKKVEYAIVCHPRFLEPVYASRTSHVSNQQELQDAIKAEESDTNVRVKYEYGKWSRLKEMPDITGYSSSRTGKCTEPMLKFWRSSAKRCGLDVSVEPTWKNFSALPLFNDIGFPRAWR